jgi:hypothetical protein
MKLLTAALLAACATSAFATGKPPVTPPTPAPAAVPVSATAQAAAAAAAMAGSVSGATASNGGIDYKADGNFYVMPAPVAAAPLPAGLCPQGDSMSIGILWNMFSYARSSTRTEMECLEKVLAVVKAQTPPQVVYRLNDGVTAEPVMCPPLKPPAKKSAAKATKKGVCNA